MGDAKVRRAPPRVTDVVVVRKHHPHLEGEGEDEGEPEGCRAAGLQGCRAAGLQGCRAHLVAILPVVGPYDRRGVGNERSEVLHLCQRDPPFVRV